MDYKAKNIIESAIKKWVLNKLNKKHTDIDFNFIVNRPFIFLIRNKQTNTLLYVAVIQYL